MTFSYDDALSTDVDVVRFLLQDTTQSGAELSDEEITYWVTSSGSAGQAALACARALHMKYSRLVDREIGDMRIWYGQKAKAWNQAISQLEKTASVTSPLEIYVAGQSKQEALDDAQNPAINHDKFKVGMHDILPGLTDISANPAVDI